MNQTTRPTECPACGVALAGRYCHACGQDTLARPRPLREWASEAFSETNLVDGRTARTLAALATRPGRLLEAYRSGAGSVYQTPLKMFVVLTALFLLTLSFAKVDIYQYVARPIRAGVPITARADPDGVTVHLTNVQQGERWMQRHMDPAIDPAVTAAVQAAADRATTNRDRQNLTYENVSNREQAAISERLAAWLPNALWILMPLYAVLLIPFFGRRRLFMEHLVFALWAHVLAFSLLILLALANKFGAGAPGWPLVFPYLAYVTAAAARYYAMPWVSALWRGAVHFGLYLGLVLMPAAVLIALTVMDLKAYLAFVSA
ncbi:MAG: DUF3667 domain-containing protein [Brevundimonas sp.]|nr:MAG: DUF3667 domain-containing protein [Brevundimonas sp.]